MIYLLGAVAVIASFTIGYMIGSERGYRQAHVKIVEAQIYRSTAKQLNFKTGDLRLVSDIRKNENST